MIESSSIMLYYLYGHGMDSFPSCYLIRLNNRKQISEWCYYIFYIICSLNFFATFQQDFHCYNDQHKHWYNNSKSIHYQPVWVQSYLIWWHSEMKIKYTTRILTIDSFTIDFMYLPSPIKIVSKHHDENQDYQGKIKQHTLQIFWSLQDSHTVFIKRALSASHCNRSHKKPDCNQQ